MPMPEEISPAEIIAPSPRAPVQNARQIPLNMQRGRKSGLPLDILPQSHEDKKPEIAPAPQYTILADEGGLRTTALEVELPGSRKGSLLTGYLITVEKGDQISTAFVPKSA